MPEHPEEFNHVRVGVSYEAADEGVPGMYPFGLRWVEVGGERLQAHVKSVQVEYESGQYSQVVISLAGATMEEVDVNA